VGENANSTRGAIDPLATVRGSVSDFKRTLL
jgi:hypothetical protein